VPYTVEFLRTAEEELAGLPKEAQRRIVRKIEGLKDEPRPPGIQQLRSPEKFLRLRVGDYRVIYVVEGKNLVVLVVSIGDRKEVYEGLEVLARRVAVWRRGHRPAS
jgi:mRNA interferase RelE/StbE